MIKVLNQILNNILLFLILFSCQNTEGNKNTDNINKITCRVTEFSIVDSSLYKLIKEDIEDYRNNHYDLFKEEPYFLLYKDKEDSTLIFMTPRAEFPCNLNNDSLFFIDSIAIGIYGNFRKKIFKFKGIKEIGIKNNRKVNERNTNEFIDNYAYPFDPFIWNYIDHNDRIIRE